MKLEKSDSGGLDMSRRGKVAKEVHRWSKKNDMKSVGVREEED